MRNNPVSGFTLLELMIAVAVAGVLLAVGAPSVSSVIQNQRLQGALGSVSQAAFAARSESAKTGNSVTICARASDTQCGSDWNNGLLVFRDNTIDRTETVAVRDASDEILRIVPPHSDSIELTAVASTDRTAASAYTPAFVRFEPDGRANWKNGTFYACDGRGTEYVAALNIMISGDIRPGRRRGSESEVPMKDAFGRVITCPS